MIEQAAPSWEKKRTQETRKVEDLLREAGFATVDAYRQNSASIRLRIIDLRFEGLSPEDRDAMVEPYLARLEERTQADIVTLLTFAPSEVQDPPRQLRTWLLNLEFDDSSQSLL